MTRSIAFWALLAVLLLGSGGQGMNPFTDPGASVGCPDPPNCGWPKPKP